MKDPAPAAREARVLTPGTQPATGSPGDDLFHRDALTLAEQSAGIGVWSIDLTTGLVRGTAQFFRIMGLAPTHDQVPVEAVRALRHPDDRDRVLAGFRSALEGGTDAYEIEYRIIRPDGAQRWIFGRGRVVRAADGTPARYSGVDLDITDRKNAEAALAAAKEELERMNRALEQRVRERTAALEAEAERRAEAESRLHQAQKMEAVGQLTGGIAHDFNNILQVILGNLEIATRIVQRQPVDAADGKARDTVLGALETAQKASRSAKQLVQRLLAFSRLQNLEPAVIDANALVESMIDMVRRTLGETISVETVLADNLWLAFADRHHLESALLNLVVNARDAMPQGGTLMIETANVELGSGYPDEVAPGQYVVVSVSDTGVGIAPDVLGKVFEPFFTTKAPGKGSGLGLSMVYGFVKQSGGHVRIYSEVASGTTVRIYLPRSRPDRVADGQVVHIEPAAADDPATMPRAQPGEAILLVEDNDDVRRFGVAALEELGYRVVQAADGPAALRLLDGVPVSLLFTDMVLPGGMSGPELATTARARRPEMPVLYTSGYTRHSAVHQGRLLAGARILAKPYPLHSLAVAIRRAIDERDSAAGK
jgi:PAS domain S-box-containing protein